MIAQKQKKTKSSPAQTHQNNDLFILPKEKRGENSFIQKKDEKNTQENNNSKDSGIREHATGKFKPSNNKLDQGTYTVNHTGEDNGYDTLTSIAKRFNTTVGELMLVNGLSSDNIVIGQKLIIPKTRNQQRNDFESYPEIKPSSGWTFGKEGVQEMDVTNGAELVIASLGNYEIANLKGQMLDAIKADSSMVEYENNIIAKIKKDTRYGIKPFFKTGSDVKEFGGQRGSGDDWFSFGENDPMVKPETWKVAIDQLTWALRHATVKYWADIDKEGGINIEYHIHDTLDLSGSEGRSDAYNEISNALGLLYHDLAGGNRNLQTRAQWSVKK